MGSEPRGAPPSPETPPAKRRPATRPSPSDRYGAQAGWAGKGHRVCLAHLIRDVQYAIDAGDAVLGPGLKGLLKRACAIGRRRARLEDATLKSYEADLDRRLDRLLALDPSLRPETSSGA